MDLFKLINAEELEKRAYQEELAKKAIEKGNTLIVAPTASGKTVIAALVSAYFLEKNCKVLMLAPTRPLALQHAETLKKLLKIKKSEIKVLTGKIPAKQRAIAYLNSKVIVATPQCIRNDLEQKLIKKEEFCLIIFDEAQHAIGNYAYVYIASNMQNARILALTASPGHEREKIEEVCKNLRISNIEILTENELKQYMPETKLFWIRVELPREMKIAREKLKSLAEKLGAKLKENGLIISKRQLYNRAELLKIQNEISERLKEVKSDKLFESASIVAALIKLSHGLLLLETQGTGAFCKYIENLNRSESSKADRMLLESEELRDAYAISKSLYEQGILHPKVSALIKVLNEELAKNPKARIIVFNHYRDSVKELEAVLKKRNIKASIFVGQAKKEGVGMSQKEQREIIEAFSKGNINVLIATSVAEEGIDIPSCDAVIFFEPVASEIRHIQRKGRTARRRSGKVIILITRKTRDESYYWSAKRREKLMVETLKELKAGKKQKTLAEFSD